MDESLRASSRRAVWFLAILWVDVHSLCRRGGCLVLLELLILERASSGAKLYHLRPGDVPDRNGDVVRRLPHPQQQRSSIPSSIHRW